MDILFNDGTEPVYVLMLHGIRQEDNEETLGRLAPFFREKGIEPIMMDYGYFNFFMPRWRNKKVAKWLADAVDSLPGQVIVVGHSNGCAITHIAAEKFKCKIDKAVYINPALGTKIQLPETVSRFDVWHSRSDWVVRLSQLIPFHIWGAMGAYGYTGEQDDRVRNFDKREDFKEKSKYHTTVFDKDKIDYFGPEIVERALERLE